MCDSLSGCRAIVDVTRAAGVRVVPVASRAGTAVQPQPRRPFRVRKVAARGDVAPGTDEAVVRRGRKSILEPAGECMRFDDECLCNGCRKGRMIRSAGGHCRRPGVFWVICSHRSVQETGAEMAFSALHRAQAGRKPQEKAPGDCGLPRRPGLAACRTCSGIQIARVYRRADRRPRTGRCSIACGVQSATEADTGNTDTPAGGLRAAAPPDGSLSRGG